jgi:hypothetical protein
LAASSFVVVPALRFFRREISSAKVKVFVGWLSDPIFSEALLLDFFDLRGDLFDAKVVGVDRRCFA